MCYLCIENKGADHLRGYREADLRHCFRHILIHGVESWNGVVPWSGVVFLELVIWSQCKSFKVTQMTL